VTSASGIPRAQKRAWNCDEKQRHQVAIGRWALLAGLIGYATLRRLGQTYGSASLERRTPMPGDDIVVKPQFVITHGITIDAPPETLWPWLVQVGWHRGGWYTAHWVDQLLFPANRESADYVMEEFQDLQVGDFIPDGAPETECAGGDVDSRADRRWYDFPCQVRPGSRGGADRGHQD
jgi:hypothetical protein